MTADMGGVFLISLLVSFLLLLAATRLCGYPIQYIRSVLAATFAGMYAACCMLPGFHFLGNILWRLVFLAGISAIAFGLDLSALRRCGIFVLLTMGVFGGSGMMQLSVAQGLTIFVSCLPIALGGWLSAIFQGRVAAASINIVAKRPAEATKGIILCGIVEFYAILSLLATILLLMNAL